MLASNKNNKELFKRLLALPGVQQDPQLKQVFLNEYATTVNNINITKYRRCKIYEDYIRKFFSDNHNELFTFNQLRINVMDYIPALYKKDTYEKVKQSSLKEHLNKLIESGYVTKLYTNSGSVLYGHFE